LYLHTRCGTTNNAAIILTHHTNLFCDSLRSSQISLTGKVLPIGGVKEKAVAARRAGITCLILPEENRRHWDELPEYLKEGMEVHFAEEYSKVFEVAFMEEDFYTTGY